MHSQSQIIQRCKQNDVYYKTVFFLSLISLMYGKRYHNICIMRPIVLLLFSLYPFAMCWCVYQAIYCELNVIMNKNNLFECRTICSYIRRGYHRIKLQKMFLEWNETLEIMIQK